MKFKDYIDETVASAHAPEHRGRTTKDHGHSHEYFIKRASGNGYTGSDNGHDHKIKRMVIQKADGHKHEMKT